MLPPSGFDTREKVEITQKYLVPKLLANIGFQKDDITVAHDAIEMLIGKLPKAEGVRGLLRAVESAIMQLNYLRLTNLDEEELAALERDEKEKEEQRKREMDLKQLADDAKKSDDDDDDEDEWELRAGRGRNQKPTTLPMGGC